MFSTPSPSPSPADLAASSGGGRAASPGKKGWGEATGQFGAQKGSKDAVGVGPLIYYIRVLL